MIVGGRELLRDGLYHPGRTDVSKALLYRRHQPDAKHASWAGRWGVNHRQLRVNLLWRAEYETLELLGSCTNDFRVIKHNRSILTGSSLVGFLHSQERKKPISTALIVKKSIFLAEHTARGWFIPTEAGWQKLAAFRRGQKWPQKFSSGAYLPFIFGHNCKFANLINYNMQYIPCYSALYAQETLFLTQMSTFCCPKASKKSVNRDKS